MPRGRKKVPRGGGGRFDSQWMDLLAHRETPVTRTGATQLLSTPALTEVGTPIDPPTPAVIQHVVLPTGEPISTKSPPRPRTALIPIPPPASIRRESRTSAKTTTFYKPHDIRAVSAALSEIMDRKNPPSSIFPTDNDGQPSDCNIKRSYGQPRLENPDNPEMQAQEEI